MPRISAWKNGIHSTDFKFFDKVISEQFTVGGTQVNVYKYMGPGTEENDDPENPTALQDFLFLENRDRRYDTDVYAIRGVYNVNDTDFNLSQFGLFLQNDTLFVTFHLNDMQQALGRRIMNGDILELPHLRDFNGLDQNIEIAMKRYYVVQDANKSAEGYSPTWWPHLWRVKMSPLTDSQEYKDILDRLQEDSDGNETEYTLRDLLSTYNKELEITDKVVEEAEKHVLYSGYDISKFYTVPRDENGNPLDPTDPANTPKYNDYTGYLTGDGLSPNGHPVISATSFPPDAVEGDYVLRIDFVPDRLFRFNGNRWRKVEDNVRSRLTPGAGKRQIDEFINNENTTTTDDNQEIPERQSLHTILRAEADE